MLIPPVSLVAGFPRIPFVVVVVVVVEIRYSLFFSSFDGYYYYYYYTIGITLSREGLEGWKKWIRALVQTFLLSNDILLPFDTRNERSRVVWEKGERSIKKHLVAGQTCLLSLPQRKLALVISIRYYYYYYHHHLCRYGYLVSFVNGI